MCAVPALFDTILVRANPTFVSIRVLSRVSLVRLCLGSSITTCPIGFGRAKEMLLFASDCGLSLSVCG